MVQVLCSTTFLFLCHSFTCLEGLSALDAGVETVRQELQSHDDCSLMQMSQMSGKQMGGVEDIHKLHTTKNAYSSHIAEQLYSASVHKTASPLICSVAVTGLVLVVALLTWGTHNGMHAMFQSVPILSCLCMFCLLLAFCHSILPILWLSARDVISHYGVLTLLSTYVAVLVLMCNPLILTMPGQATSQLAASKLFNEREELAASKLFNEREEENAQQGHQGDKRKLSLLYVSILFLQVASGVSVFHVATHAGEHKTSVCIVTTFLYGILAWCSLLVLYEYRFAVSSVADPENRRESQKTSDTTPEDVQFNIHTCISFMLEGVYNSMSLQRVWITEKVSAATAWIEKTEMGMYAHYFLWVAYSVGMLVFSVCLGVRICYAIFDSRDFYVAVFWTMLVCCEFVVYLALHMEIILQEPVLTGFSPGERGRLVGKRVAWTVVFLFKYLGIALMLTALACAALDWPSQLFKVQRNLSTGMSLIFFYALALVALEEVLGINKSAVVLLLAATLWTMVSASKDPAHSVYGRYWLLMEESKSLSDVGSVIFFLLPAMALVETMDHLGGFTIVTTWIQWSVRRNKDRLVPLISFLVFFLSSSIDNLTATLVALKILRQVLPNDADKRRECGCLVVIAANAGGAWSPIGDVTTTMLWISNKISFKKTVISVIMPSFVAILIPLLGLRLFRPRPPTDESLKPGQEKSVSRQESVPNVLRQESVRSPREEYDESIRSKKAVLALGFTLILFVPVLRTISGLPPYIGMLLAFGVMWLMTDLLGLAGESSEEGHQSQHGGVIAALRKVDLTGLLFFTGVLLSVGALNAAGVLHMYALDAHRIFGDNYLALCAALGISSSVVDNVPLVEAAIDMFKGVPCDDSLWQLVALAAGTGGSILIIGSIPGITLMSLENVGFLWYARRVSLLALLGFICGLGAYQLQSTLRSFLAAAT